MELAKNEIIAITETVELADDLVKLELGELELSLIGGGSADPLFS